MFKKLFGKSEPAYTPIKSEAMNTNVATVKQSSTASNQTSAKDQNNQKPTIKKAELFKRIKPATVAHLIRRGADLNCSRALTSCPDAASVLGLPEGHVLQQTASKITDISNVSTISYASVQLSLNENTEYILVDLRDRNFYDFHHIQGAIHFPGVGVYRDEFIPEILDLKNKKDALIIVYHVDEIFGGNYATGFTEKGFENVFLISGGIKAFQQEAPDLIESKKTVPTDKKKVMQEDQNFNKTNYKNNKVDKNESVIVFSGKGSNNPY